METARFKIIAIIAAVVTAVLAFYYLNRVEASKPVQTTVLEAVSDIPAGTFITSDMIQPAEIYESDVIPSATNDSENVVGMYATSDMYAGEQISTQKVTDQAASSSVSSFSYKIPEGMRTVTIAIDPTTSVANMIQVGDHVDILATYTKTVEEKKNRPENADEDADSSDTTEVSTGETVTRFIADNIEVAALDQTIVRSDSSESDDSSTEQTYTTVTLFVTPELAKALIWENQNGSIVFTLRSPNETENPDHEEFSAASMEDF